MRSERRLFVLAAMTLSALTATPSVAQNPSDAPVLAARRVLPAAGIKIWVPAGRLSLIAWDRDSILVRGRASKAAGFFFGGDSTGVKLGVDRSGSNGSATLTVYLPRRAMVSVKTVSTMLEANGVGGWFYSVSGSMHLAGSVASVEAESMNGNLDLDLTTPWLKARTGDGHLLVRGAPEDVDASTIAGTLDIATTSVMRAQFGSVSGDIHYVGSPAPGAIFEFSNHSGNVDLLLPQTVSGVFTLSSIVGQIENGFNQARPVATPLRSMRLSLGRGGAQVAVRTFKGTIRVRPQ